jgi:hypothetical protein
MAFVGLFVGMVFLLVGAAMVTFLIVDVGQRPQDIEFDFYMRAVVACVVLVATGGTAVITSVQHFRKGNDENE